MQSYTGVSLRMGKELKDSAEIMASILGQTVSEYIIEAVKERLAGDIDYNAKAYAAVLAARQDKQQKGA